MDDSNKIATAYQAAIEMANHEGDNVWSRFNVTIVANSVILFALTSDVLIDTSEGSKIFAILGILLCLAWLPLMKRSFAYETYYILKARMIEEHLELGTLNVLDDGSKLGNRETVQVLHYRKRMGSLASIPARKVVDFIIGLFFSAYFWFLLPETKCIDYAAQLCLPKWLLLILVFFLYGVILVVVEQYDNKAETPA
jgi:hypothetical protein